MGGAWGRVDGGWRPIEHWLWFLVLGLAAGFLAGAVVQGHGFGLLGGFLSGLLGLGVVSIASRLVCAFVGAVGLLWLVKFLKRRGA